MKKPHWIKKEVVLAAHEELLSQHGGSDGLRDEGLPDSALARSQNAFSYGKASIFDQAAAYTLGIIKNHPFIDGNKRTAFLTGYIFLGLNGYDFQGPEAETTVHVIALAAGEIS